MFLDNKAICWDMNNTLGRFRAIAYELYGLPKPWGLPAPGLKPGIRELLEKLTNSGCKNFLTTRADKAYAREVLTRFELNQYFEGIFTYEQIYDGVGKHYRPAAKIMGYTDEEARKKMVVVGDAERDHPRDIKGLTFIYHPHGRKHEARIIGEIVEMLATAGNGDIRSGFNCLKNEPLWLMENQIRVELYYKNYGGFTTILDERTPTAFVNASTAVFSQLEVYR